MPLMAVCSKDILSLGSVAGGPSANTTLKLCRAVRLTASVYLQDHLLLLPSLPSPDRLRQIREAMAREAEERQQRLVKQERLALRQREEAHGAGVGGGVKTNPLDKLMGRVQGMAFKRGGGGGGGEGEEGWVEMDGKDGGRGGGGWMGESLVVGSSGAREDPFELQKQQLLSFIGQAKVAGKMDEVAALEASLRDIEALISQGQAADCNS